MSSLSVFLAPLALLIPASVSDAPGSDAPHLVPRADIAETQTDGAARGWLMLDALEAAAINQQVRIERRLVVRISPRAPIVRQNMAADIVAAPVPARTVERKFGKCVPVNGIAGVQPTRDNRLMLFMRDQRVITARLEKSCRANDFYSGFYVERSKDGMLCIDRDKLHSRTGANCEVNRMRQLVSE